MKTFDIIGIVGLGCFFSSILLRHIDMKKISNVIGIVGLICLFGGMCLMSPPKTDQTAQFGEYGIRTGAVYAEYKDGSGNVILVRGKDETSSHTENRRD